MPQPKNRKPLLLVMDGHAMIFRAWFSIPERLSTSTGRDTRGAYGFLTTFLKVIRDHSPTHVALTLDTRAPTFRDDLFPQYKAHRPPVDPEIHEQIPMVKSIMQAFKIPVLEYDGFEADDLVGTLSTRAENEGIETLIVTGDADQLQLVSPHVRLLMYSGFGDTRVYDVECRQGTVRGSRTRIRAGHEGARRRSLGQHPRCAGRGQEGSPGRLVQPRPARTGLRAARPRTGNQRPAGRQAGAQPAGRAPADGVQRQGTHHHRARRAGGIRFRRRQVLELRS